MYRKVSVVLLSLLILPALLFAGTNGKISGKVVDRETKEPLPGANILVDGTTLGASTDLNGDYVILNVPVGGYTVKCTFIGYRTVTVSNVRVSVDLTTELNFDMPTEAVEIGEVSIVAERPLVNKNATNEVHIRTAEEIQNLPVRGYAAVAGLQAGVVQQGGNLFIRGGRREEVTFYVDGVYQNNPFDSNRSGDLSSNAIEEVQVQNGGFNAEYGFANSGLIHTTTKTGGTAYNFTGEYITDEFLSETEENLGAFSYGYNIYNLTASGPVPNTNNRVKFFLVGERQFLRDRLASAGGHPALVNGVPTLVQGPLPSNSLGRWNWNGNFLIDVKPLQFKIGGNSTRDNRRDFYFGVANSNANALFNSARQPKRLESTDSYYIKATHSLGTRSFYTATASYFRNEFEYGDYVWFDDLESYGDPAKNPQLRGPGLNPSTDDFEARFSKAGSVRDFYQHNKSTFLGLKGDLTHQAGKTHQFQAGFEYRYNTVRNYQIAPMGIAQTRAANPTLSDIDVYTTAFANNIGYDVLGKTEVNSGRDAARHPKLGAAYLQDKIELQDLVVNIGVRWDYFDPATPQFRDPELIVFDQKGQIANQVYLDASGRYASGTPTAQDQTGVQQLVDGKTYSNLNPRLGVSFPVTDRTVFHAQYGKFTQQPQLNQLFISYIVFANNLQSGNFTQSGNPALQPVKTTSYEVGFRQQIGDNASLDITAYYKEIRDLVQQRNIFAEPVPYAAFVNGDFGTVKGLTATFDLRRTNRVAATASYTLQFAGGTGSAGAEASNINWLGNPPTYPSFVSPLDFDQRHTLALNLDFRTNKGEGPMFLNGRPLGQVGLNLLLTLGSGFPYTPGQRRSSIFQTGPAAVTRPQAAINSAYTPFTYQLDGKLDKSFAIAGVNFNVYLWALNILGAENVTGVYDQTGEADNDGFLTTPEGIAFANSGSAANAAAYYAARVATPFNFGIPRQYRLGLRFDFR
ncbi:TonB-dependent receptor [candidate division KSB1 bacterium]|nr:TonB-dependent receptor [candidate division KSB1 bacterium]